MNASIQARSTAIRVNNSLQKGTMRMRTMKGFGRLTALLGCALAISALPACPAQAQNILSDSMTDFVFGAQGFNNWQYGFDRTDNPGFQLFDQFNGTKWDHTGTADYSTYLDMYGGRTSSPSSAVDVYAVRRWTSPYSGWIVVRGDYAHMSNFLSNLKTRADILLRPNGFGSASTLQTLLISHEDNQVRPYTPILVKVKKNNVLDFVLSPYENDNDDIARFTAIIEKGVKPVIYGPARMPRNSVAHGYVWLPGAPTGQTGPISFTLTSSNPSVIGMNSSGGTVAVGSQISVFDIKAYNVSVPTTVKLTANFPALGKKVSTNITVVP